MGIYGLVKLTEFLSVSYIPSELLPTRSIFTVVSVVFLILFIHTYVYLQGSKCIIKWYKAQKIQESEKSYLFSILEDLSTKAKIKSPELYSFDSEIPSIFTVGTKKSPSIVISTSMLKTFDNLELEALIAHEFGHIKCGHIYTNTLVALVAGTIMSFPNFVMSFSTILGFGQPEDPIPRVFEFYATALTAPIAAIIIHSISPAKRELAADKEAIMLTENPVTLAKVFMFLENYIPLQPASNKFNLCHLHLFSTHTQQLRGHLSIFTFMFDTHPEISDRVSKIINHNDCPKNTTLFGNYSIVPGFFDVKKWQLALGISFISYMIPLFFVLFAVTYSAKSFNLITNLNVAGIYTGTILLLMAITAKLTKGTSKNNEPYFNLKIAYLSKKIKRLP